MNDTKALVPWEPGQLARRTQGGNATRPPIQDAAKSLDSFVTDWRYTKREKLAYLASEIASNANYGLGFMAGTVINLGGTLAFAANGHSGLAVLFGIGMLGCAFFGIGTAVRDDAARKARCTVMALRD